MKKERESSFELLRIVAQFMIVYYHILYFAIYPIEEIPFYKALWFPLHIGVPLFVFISGYFRIKPSINGFCKLIGMVCILQIPYVVETIVNLDEVGWKTVLKMPFFISYTPFWFIRTYVFLYLFSLVINKFLDEVSLIQRIYLLVILFYISVYIGVLGSDDSLRDGKNLVTFLLYYSIGDTLRFYKEKWDKLNIKWLIITFLLFNAIVVITFSLLGYEKIVDAVWKRIFFAYCSPMLILNAIWMFLIIGKFHFHSNFVNKIGKTSLAMYMIHGTFLFSIINPIVIYFYELNNTVPMVLLNVFVVTLLTLTACVLIYYMLNPIWNLIGKIGEMMQKKIEETVYEFKE